MRVAVIVPTFGRCAELARFLAHLEGQNRAPDAVIVSSPTLEHIPSYEAINYPLSVVLGPSGLCAQRNNGLRSVLPWADIITFFDDDFLPADDYLERLVKHFQRLDDVVAIMGHAAVDGARGASLTFEEGLMALRALESGNEADDTPRDQTGTYGCNMSIRASSIGELRFDERLALYGWQEDIDFTGRLRSSGRVVSIDDLVGVHLGVKSGRVSGVRFGYSQIINPTYLIRKGSIPRSFGINLMLRNVAANILRSPWPEALVDRRGRLKGNVIATLHLIRGRIEPEYIHRL